MPLVPLSPGVGVAPRIMLRRWLLWLLRWLGVISEVIAEAPEYVFLIRRHRGFFLCLLRSKQTLVLTAL